MITAALAVRKILTGLPKALDSDALIKAHGYAEDFHCAMSRALSAEQDIETLTSQLKVWTGDRAEILRDLATSRRLHSDALGEAAVAATKMPAIWLALLGVKVERAPAAVLPAAE